MPEKQDRIINPYRFVAKNEPRYQQKKSLEEILHHEKYSGISGSIRAEMITLTPLVIGGRENPYAQKEVLDKKDMGKAFCHDPETGRPIVPGSGLKGVISTLYEILAGSQQACKAIFGDIETKYGGQNLKGHVYFSDAAIDTERSPEEALDASKLPKQMTILTSPKDRHKAFYKDKKTDQTLSSSSRYNKAL